MRFDMALNQKLFTQIFKFPQNKNKILRFSWLETPIGQMIMAADGDEILTIEFTDRICLEENLKKLFHSLDASFVIDEKSDQFLKMKEIVNSYFAGEVNQNFKKKFIGTDFQKKIWQKLTEIPFGETCAYSTLAMKIGAPKAARAAGSAVGANQFVIFVPCHRIVKANGEIGQFASGVQRKKWLLDHEKKFSKLANLV